MNNFETVYLFTEHRSLYAAWLVAFAVGAWLVAFLLLCYIIRARKRRVPSADRYLPERLLVILSIFGFISWSHGEARYSGVEEPYARYLEQYTKGEYAIVEGVVHIRSTEPAEGHGRPDIVEISHETFAISYYSSTAGYARTIAHGGILREGFYVRVYYVEEPSYSKFCQHLVCSTVVEYEDVIIRIDLQIPVRPQVVIPTPLHLPSPVATSPGILPTSLMVKPTQKRLPWEGSLLPGR